MNLITTIDTVLEWFYKNRSIADREDGTFLEKNLLEKYPELSDVEGFGLVLAQIMSKLLRDGYVEHIIGERATPTSTVGEQFMIAMNGRDVHRITFEGDFFYLQKGYQGQIDRENERNSRLAIEAQRNDNAHQMNVYLFWITILIAAATAIQAAGVLFEVLRNYYNPRFALFRDYFFPYAFGLSLLLILWLILKRIHKKLNN